MPSKAPVTPPKMVTKLSQEEFVRRLRDINLGIHASPLSFRRALGYKKCPYRVFESSARNVPWAVSLSTSPLREHDMRTPRTLVVRILLIALFIGSHLPLIGCTDESKTSGTMVERSEEAKAHLKAKAEKYKGGPAKSKAPAPAN
jgi:hypothetical protein